MQEELNKPNLYAIKANTEKEIEQLSLAILEKYKQIRDKEDKLRLIQKKIWEAKEKTWELIKDRKQKTLDEEDE